MAFTSVLKAAHNLGNGFIGLDYSFNGASVTTGTITVPTSGENLIAEVISATPSSDGDTAVICALDVAQNKVKLTFTSSDTGRVFIMGKAVN